MGRFIEISKMNALREAARKGDVRAQKILRIQMEGGDFGSLIDEFFANPSPTPAPVPQSGITEQKATAPSNTANSVGNINDKVGSTTAIGSTHDSSENVIETKSDEELYPGIKDPKLIMFLKRNDVKHGDMEYEDTIETYYKEFPSARPKDSTPQVAAPQATVPQEQKATEPSGGKSIYEGEDDEPFDFNAPIDKDIRIPNDPGDNASIYGDEDEDINDDYPAPEQKDFLSRLIDEEIKAIESYNSAILEVMKMEGESDTVKKGLRTDLEEIRNDEIEHVEKLKRIKESLAKKEEVAEPAL